MNGKCLPYYQFIDYIQKHLGLGSLDDSWSFNKENLIQISI